MGYEIRIVSNEEFDTLPYKGAKNALGLADPRTNVAYVRSTGVRELDDNTINHEFDELMMRVSPHEEDGIRYKSGGGLGKILGPVIGAVLSFFGTPALGVPVGAAIAGGTGAHSRNVKPEKYGENTFGNIALDAGLGGLGAYAGGKLLTGAAGGWGAAGKGASLGSKIGGALKGAVGIGGKGAAAGASAGAGFGAPATAAPLAGSALPLSSAGGTLASLGTPAAVGSNFATGAAAAAGQAIPLAAAAPVGQSLLSKFGGFVGEAAKKAAKSAGTDAVLGAFQQPQQEKQQVQGSLFPESRTPVSGGGSSLAGGTLNAFNPSILGTDSFNPISQEEYNLGRTNIGTAKQKSIAELFKTPAFRGQSPEENTGLANQLSGLNTGFEDRYKQYDLDIGAANLSREYEAVRDANKLSKEHMNYFVELAQKSNADISSAVSNTPEEFKSIFGHLKIA